MEFSSYVYTQTSIFFYFLFFIFYFFCGGDAVVGDLGCLRLKNTKLDWMQTPTKMTKIQVLEHTNETILFTWCVSNSERLDQ